MPPVHDCYSGLVAYFNRKSYNFSSFGTTREVFSGKTHAQHAVWIHSAVVDALPLQRARGEYNHGNWSIMLAE